MKDTLINLLPFALGSAISPVMLTGSVLILSSKISPVKKAIGFAFGSAAALVAIAIMIFLLSAKAGQLKIGSHQSTGQDILHVAAGLLLIYFAIKTAIKKPKTPSSNQAKKHKRGLAAFILLGIILMGTNISTLALYFPASAVISKSGLNSLQKTLSMAFMMIFSLIPVFLPLLLVIILGKHSDKLLGSLNRSVTKYGSYVMGGLFGIFGIYLFVKGILAFL
ncbi:MAG: GAP family protein [bacterium]|nr:GAP family protein [bacterium]